MAVTLVTDKDFADQLKSNQRVVVKYYADWCGSCKLFAPKYKRISNDEANKDIIFLEVNAEENPDARKLAGVDNLPFFAVFKDGALLKASATSKEEVVTEMINELKK